MRLRRAGESNPVSTTAWRAEAHPLAASGMPMRSQVDSVDQLASNDFGGVGAKHLAHAGLSAQCRLFYVTILNHLATTSVYQS